MKLNSILRIRISSELKQELKKISEELGFRENDLIRYFLKGSLEQLKRDSIKAGGMDKLTFTLRK